MKNKQEFLKSQVIYFTANGIWQSKIEAESSHDRIISFKTIDLQDQGSSRVEILDLNSEEMKMLILSEGEIGIYSMLN